MGPWDELRVVGELVGRNMRRWKWRLLSVSVLIAVSFTLYLLYSSSLTHTVTKRADEAASLNLPFDLMIATEPGMYLLDDQFWPGSGFQSGYGQDIPLYSDYEWLIRLIADSDRGEWELYAPPAESSFFPSPQMSIQGRWLRSDAGAEGEIVLPAAVAAERGIELGDTLRINAWLDHPWQTHRRSLALRVVGIYEGSDLQAGFIAQPIAQELILNQAPNALVFRLNQERFTNLDMLLRWIGPVYPEARFLHAETPRELSRDLWEQVHQPSRAILVLIAAFIGIGVLAIAVMTFLERRQEIAALKTVGMSNRQVSVMLLMEYVLATLFGLLSGGLMIYALMHSIAWMQELSRGVLLPLVVQALFVTLTAVALAVFYPVYTARIASVDQLLYARRIPLGQSRLDHMDQPGSDLVYRERQENLRILKLLPSEEAVDMLVLKQPGDSVKRGEIIASREVWFGFYLQEWASPCDGVVTEVSLSGVVAISPSDPEEPFYAYPAQLLENEQRMQSMFLRGREDMKEAKAAYAPGQGEAVVQLELERMRSRAAARQRELERGREKRAESVIDYAAQARKEQGAASKRKGMRPALLLLGISAFSLLLYVSIDQAARKAHATQTATPYQTTKATIRDVRLTVGGRGYLSAQEEKVVRPAFGGRIETITAVDGTWVEPGQELVRLHSAELEESLTQAQLRVNEAQRTCDTFRLFSQQTQIVDAEQHLQLAAAQAEKTAAQLEVDRLLVRASAAGYVAEMIRDLGEDIATGDALLSLDDSLQGSPDERKAAFLTAKSALAEAERAWQALQLRAETGGTVEAVFVEEGAWAEADELLVRIVSESLPADTASLELEAARIRRDELSARREQLNLRAEHDGVLSWFDMAEGSELAIGQRLGRLDDVSELLLTVPVPQNRIADVELGAKADIKWGHVNRKLQGRVVEIGPQGQRRGEDQTVVFPVVIRFVNDDVTAAGQKASARIEGTGGRIGPLTGEVKPVRQSELHATAAGVVCAVYVETGSYVQEGDLLLRLSSPELELAAAQTEADLHRFFRQELRAPRAALIEALAVQEGMSVEAGQVVLSLADGVAQAVYAKAYRELQAWLRQENGSHPTAATASGKLAKLYVEPGQWLEAGDIVAELENPELSYRLKRAEWKLEQAQSESAASRQNPLALPMAQAELALEQARLALKQAQQRVDGLVVTAPCAGWISFMRPLCCGDDLSAGQSLALIRSARMQLVVDIDELLLNRLQVGMTAELQVDAFGDEPFTATVAHIGSVGRIAEGGSSFPVHFHIDEDPRLRSGMTAVAEVVGAEQPLSLAIPTDYLHRRPREGQIEYYVLRLVEQDKLLDTVVEVGLIGTEFVQITSGLRQDDIVARALRD